MVCGGPMQCFPLQSFEWLHVPSIALPCGTTLLNCLLEVLLSPKAKINLQSFMWLCMFNLCAICKHWLEITIFRTCQTNNAAHTCLQQEANAHKASNQKITNICACELKSCGQQQGLLGSHVCSACQSDPGGH